MSIKFTQNNVGHSRSETTTNIYAKNNEDMIKVAQERINSIFKNCCRNVVEKSENENKNVISFSEHLSKRNKKEGLEPS